MSIIKPSTAFKQGADWVSGEVRSYMKDQVSTHVDLVQDVRDNDFEQTRFLYVRSKAATYRLDLSSGAADDGDTVLRDNVGRHYLKVPGSGGGTAWDVQVDNIAGRDVYDGEPVGFSVLVADVGDERAAVYERVGPAGNWTDPAYLSGPPGPIGPAGDGFNPAGAWDVDATYDKNDMVSHGPRSFVSFANGNTGNEPPDADEDDVHWQFVPAAVGPKGETGDEGPQGEKGDTGDTGSTGPANVLSIGTVTGGDTADASITGTSPAQVLNLVLPKGDKGDQGDEGPQGPAGQDGTGTGDVVGPDGGVTDGHLVVFDGATGKVIKSSGSAPLALGTTSGTAAAGDDSRITGALQTGSRTAVSVIGRSANSAGDAADIAAGANDRILARVSNALSWVQLTIDMIPDALITYAKMAAGAIASFGEFNSATASKLLSTASVWGNLAVLTDAATISVDLNAGYDFGGASNAALALAGNRTLGAPSNARNGKKGVLWFGATGATRTLTLHANWVLATGVEAGPYSITTAQALGVAYVCRGTTVIVTAIVRVG